MNSDFISVVVPAYNEAVCIQSTLEKLVAYLSARFSRFEIIVADDGSVDRTRAKVAESASKDPRVRLLSFAGNHGKGFAVRQGILDAKGESIFFTDADLSTPPEEIETALACLKEGFSVVIASRRHPQSVITRHQPRMREAVGAAFNRAVRALLSLEFRDTQCGFKAFSATASRQIFSLARIDGFAFDAEILVIARNLGCRVKEIPVRWSNAPDSKVSLGRHLYGVVKDLLRIYRNDRRGVYERRV